MACQSGDVLIRAMGAQQGKERERTAPTVGSLHSLTLASAGGSRPLKPKTNSLRPARDSASASARSQAFNVFVEHNGEWHLFNAYIFFLVQTIKVWFVEKSSQGLIKCNDPSESRF